MASIFQYISVLRLLPQRMQLQVYERHAAITAAFHPKQRSSFLALPPELRAQVFEHFMTDAIATHRAQRESAEEQPSTSQRAFNNGSISHFLKRIASWPIRMPRSLFNYWKTLYDQVIWKLQKECPAGAPFVLVFKLLLLSHVAASTDWACCFLTSTISTVLSFLPPYERLPNHTLGHELLALLAMTDGMVQLVPALIWKANSVAKRPSTTPNSVLIRSRLILDLPILTLNQQLMAEAFDVFHRRTILCLTSSQAVQISKRAALVDQIRYLAITGGPVSGGPIFAMDVWRVSEWHIMLLRLLKGEKLKSLTIDLEPCYHISSISYRADDFFAAVEVGKLPRWKCTGLGRVEYNQQHPSRYSITAIPEHLLRRIRFDHSRLIRLWQETLQMSYPRRHSLPPFHWNIYPIHAVGETERKAWSEQEVDGKAMQVFELIRLHIRRVKLGRGNWLFVSALAPYMPREDMGKYPGEVEWLCGFWTDVLANEIVSVRTGERTDFSRGFLI